jgi:FkbM family methyltransferase
MSGLVSRTFAGLMKIDIEDCWIRNHLVQGVMFEEPVIKQLEPYVKKSKYVVDVGANIGCHTVSYGFFNPDVSIWAVEPQKRLFSTLLENIKLNNLGDRVTPVKSALGHKNDTIRLQHTSREFNEGQGINLAGIGIGNDGEEVSMVTLDSLNLPGLDFMKIDVEGAEGLVITGGQETIKKFKPVILFEHNGKFINPCDVDMDHVPTPFEVLTRLGYNNFVHIGTDNFLTWVGPCVAVP